MCTYHCPAHFKPVTEQTHSTQEIIHVGDEQWMEHGRRQFNVSKVTGTGEVRESTCRTTERMFINQRG